MSACHVFNFNRCLGVMLDRDMALEIADLILATEPRSEALEALLRKIEQQFKYIDP